MSRESALVNADWVAEHLEDPKVVLIEVDEDTSAYDRSHIQGAIKLDWTTDLQDQVRRDFVNKAQFEALLSEKGVSNDHTVVLYGGNNNW
ncbi:MAG: rhodanese-like domain-containing protein, partial [Marmoricola sp.]